MNIVAVIQARLGSSRLPGKVMMDIGGKTMLERVVDNARNAVRDVVIITPRDNDRRIIDYAMFSGIPLFYDTIPGNLLGSYYHCARYWGIKHIMRITADNPMIQPAMLLELISLYSTGEYDWAANCRLKHTYPVGNDAEIFSANALNIAYNKAMEIYELEHVTPYIYRHPELFRLGILENKKDESGKRWTVDTQEDLDNIRELFKIRSKT